MSSYLKHVIHINQLFKIEGFCICVCKINWIFPIYEVCPVGCDPLLDQLSQGKIKKASEPQICLK